LVINLTKLTMFVHRSGRKDQNYIDEENKWMNWRNVCYDLSRGVCFFHMVHKHLLHTRVYKTTDLHFIVTVIRTPPLTPLNNMYEDGGLRVLFELKRKEVRRS